MALSIDTTSYPSPNWDLRPQSVRSIVLHTGEGTKISDLATLRNNLVAPAKRVSAHYYVDRAGRVYMLVDPLHRAWHAGVSSYQGLTDWNDHSIGIETEHKAGQDWPAAQRQALAALCRILIERFKIQQSYIAAHRWIAPDRKMDPSDWSNSDLHTWIAALYQTPAEPPPARFTFGGLRVYKSSMLIGEIAVHLPDGAHVEIDQIGGAGYAAFAGHVKRATWGVTEIREPGFVDVRLLDNA